MRSQIRPALVRFLCTGVIAHPALCTEYPRFCKIGDKREHAGRCWLLNLVQCETNRWGTDWGGRPERFFRAACGTEKDSHESGAPHETCRFRSGRSLAGPLAQLASLGPPLREIAVLKAFCATDRELLSACIGSPTQDRMCSRLCAYPPIAFNHLSSLIL